MNPNKVAVVTGGTGGIGLAAARALREKGCKVYTISRRGEESPEHIPADVTAEESFAAALQSVYEREGRLDILVNNAGFGISGAAEFTANEDAKRLLEVNLFGVVNGCKAAVPIMRGQGFGRIVNISSVAAVAPIPFQAWYSVSKSAVSTFSMALANEVKPFGIEVCTVLPGDIRTGFTAAREKSAAGDDIYNGRIARSVAVMEHDEETGMDPAVAGRYIADIALRKRVKTESAIGLSYKALAVLARCLPAGLKQFVLGLLYGGK